MLYNAVRKNHVPATAIYHLVYLNTYPYLL